MADTLSDVMDALTACACEALSNIDRPACGCGLTIGAPAEGPLGCACDCPDGSGSGKVSGFLERVYPVDGSTFEQVARLNCRPGAIAADISIVVVRCYPTMSEAGVMPDLDTTTPFAHNLNDDLAAVWNALNCCGDNLTVREAAIDGDPEGGCSGFAIRVTTLVSLPAATVDVS